MKDPQKRRENEEIERDRRFNNEQKIDKYHYHLLQVSNASLVVDRYLRNSVKDPDYTQRKLELLSTTAHAVKFSSHSQDSINLYKLAYERHFSIVRPHCREFKTEGRMIIGLGSEIVVETGITLHHTYGVPFIPGSALKGLASHYCSQVWGSKEIGFKLGNKYHNLLFGKQEDAGHITFHDAWITPKTVDSSIKPDVMTPHHGDYYKGEGAPTDFDDPKPVPFISVSGTFLIAISCDDPTPAGTRWAELSLSLLTHALSDWGIGGKTNSGYGKMKLFR